MSSGKFARSFREVQVFATRIASIFSSKEEQTSFEEGIEIAKDLTRGSRHAGFVKNFLASVVAAAAVSFCYFLYTHLDAWFVEKQSAAFQWVVLAVAFLAFIVTLFHLQWNFDQQRRLARLHLDLAQQFQTMREMRRLPDVVLANAMGILNEALRLPLDKSLTTPNKLNPYSREELKLYLLKVLDYAAMLLETRSRERVVRCGLIVEDPRNPGDFRPFLVYAPNDDSYTSSNTFGPEDLPGRLLEEFREHKDRPEFQNYCCTYIGDVPAYEEEHWRDKDRAFSYRHEGQREYLKCILAAVLYVRDGKRGRRPVGVLSFDAPEPFYFTMDRYERALPLLRIAYRILGIRLAIVFGNDEIVQKESRGHEQLGFEHASTNEEVTHNQTSN